MMDAEEASFVLAADLMAQAAVQGKVEPGKHYTVLHLRLVTQDSDEETGHSRAHKIHEEFVDWLRSKYTTDEVPLTMSEDFPGAIPLGGFGEMSTGDDISEGLSHRLKAMGVNISPSEIRGLLEEGLSPRSKEPPIDIDEYLDTILTAVHTPIISPD